MYNKLHYSTQGDIKVYVSTNFGIPIYIINKYTFTAVTSRFNSWMRYLSC